MIETETPYQSTTEQVRIEVFPFYVEERSDPQKNFFFYAYKIKIHNLDQARTVQLQRRHWIITDGRRHREEVYGDGVIGVCPILAPGQSFEYTSFCPLPTPTGNMRGSYFFSTLDQDKKEIPGEEFKVEIPLFFLRMPQTFH